MPPVYGRNKLKEGRKEGKRKEREGRTETN